jgi:transposase
MTTRPDVLPLPPQGDAQRDAHATGLTVRDVARRYRVSKDRVRAWIRRGELRAITTADLLASKPRWVIPPEALAEFENARQGGTPPKPKRSRSRAARELMTTDLFP